MKDLDYCRNRIDEIDKKLIELFEERMNIVVDVARYKEANNLPIFNKKREDEVIAKNVARVKDEDLKSYTRDMLHSLMDISKEYQCEKIGRREAPLAKGKEIKLGFQGDLGSFGEEALIKYFGEDYARTNFEEFEDVFTALKFSEIDYGVLPIENSSTGSITLVYDLLKKYGFHIVGETLLKIEQNLLAPKGSKIEDIEEIYSHSQGFEQSSDFIKTLKGVKTIPYHNTAISAKYVSELNDDTKAAIAGKRAAKIYDLDVLEAGINNAKENYTRFIVIGRNFETTDLCNKLTIAFTIANKAGYLYKQLEAFSDSGINMRKIESRPIGNGSFNYFFYVDIDGNINIQKIKEALDKVKSTTEDFKILGAYKRQE
ncbi:MAG: chorismate mutase [Sarcina sp.]